MPYHKHCWELQEDGEPSQAAAARENETLKRRDGAAGDGTEACASDVWVQVAIPEVVDSAACTAHNEGAGEEQCSGGNDGQW